MIEPTVTVIKFKEGEEFRLGMQPGDNYYHFEADYTVPFLKEARNNPAMINFITEQIKNAILGAIRLLA